MTAVSIITFRETLEVSLIVGIVFSYLRVAQNRQYSIFVWLGVLVGVVASVLLALLFHISFGGFEGKAEALYEGCAMFIAAFLITWMVFWMHKQSRSFEHSVEMKVSRHVHNNHPLGIFFLIFVSTVREGVETVIFLQAALVQSGGASQVLAGFLGMAVAIGVGYLLYRGVLLLNIRHFFTVTSALLMLFAATLVAQGMHELQEAELFSRAVPESGMIGSHLSNLSYG